MDRLIEHLEGIVKKSRVCLTCGNPRPPWKTKYCEKSRDHGYVYRYYIKKGRRPPPYLVS